MMRKKCTLLLLVFWGLITQIVYASQKDHFSILDIGEKKVYLLSVLTSPQGEGKIGENVYSKVQSRFGSIKFYVSTERCETEVCIKSKPYVLEGAQKFAEDYNSLVNEEHQIQISGESSWFGIPIYLTDEGIGNSKFHCRSKNEIGELSRCDIEVGILSLYEDEYNYHIQESAIKKILNLLGFHSTEQEKLIGCITYAFPTRNTKIGYQGLCELERRAILFAKQHLELGMNHLAIASVFEKKWRERNPNFWKPL